LFIEKTGVKNLVELSLSILLKKGELVVPFFLDNKRFDIRGPLFNILSIQGIRKH
jgi:hypothetical protein